MSPPGVVHCLYRVDATPQQDCARTALPLRRPKQRSRQIDVAVRPGHRTLYALTCTALVDLPLLLTIGEAAVILNIKRALAYKLAKLYLSSGGRDGIPVIALGGCHHVPVGTIADPGPRPDSSST